MSKIMLITGGSRGIGAATALLAAKEGYTVIVNYYQNDTAAHSVCSEIEHIGGKALAIQADVSSEKDILNLFSKIDRTFGKLDILINNAGVLGKRTNLKNMSATRMRKVFDTNIIGSLLCSREAIKRMSTAHGGLGGSIVNISSIAAKMGGPNEYIDYAATKGAMDTMTIGLSKEVAAEGIRVNAVRPGLIETDIHEAGRLESLVKGVPMQRTGTSEEVAELILWLVSEKASYMNGALIDISGGR